MTEVKPSFPVRELLTAGVEAPKVLVRHVVETTGRDVQATAIEVRASPDFDAEEHIDRLIASQLMLARAEGAGAGLAATLAEMSSLITGPAAVAVVGTTMLTDLTALAWIQIRLSLMIAAAYGHDLHDVETRTQEILSLHSLEASAGAAVGPAMGRAGQRVGRRLLERYLRGSLLVTLKAMFRLVGIKFSRAALVRGLPFVNVPANAALADVTTRRTSAKARKYYRSLPARAKAM